MAGAYSCEEWAIWGIAERFGSETYLVFRHSSGPDAILRRKVSDGSDEVILDLAALETTVGGNADASDICSISIAPSRGQWVYHGENVDSILGIGPEFDGGEETTGVCPAVFDAPAL